MKRFFKWLKRIFVTEENNTFAQLTALNTGSYYAKKHPTKVKKAQNYCDMIMSSGANFNQLFEEAKGKLIEEAAEDELMTANLRIIFSGIKIDNNIDIRLSKQVVQAFKTGLMIKG